MRQLESISRKLHLLDLDLPDSAAPLIALRQAVSEASVALNPIAELEANILDGTVTADNAAEHVANCAAALTMKDKAVQVAQTLEPLLDQIGARWLIANGDNLIALIRPAFDQAVNDLRNTVEALGAKPNQAAVLAAGPAAAIAWEARVNAIRRIDATFSAVGALEGAGYRIGAYPAARYLASVPDEPTLADAARYLSGSRIAEAIANGVAFHLNTNTEAATVIDAARDHTARQAAAARAKQDEAQAAARARRADDKAADIKRLKQLEKTR